MLNIEKSSDIKHQGKLWHYKKFKPKNNRTRDRGRRPSAGVVPCTVTWFIFLPFQALVWTENICRFISTLCCSFKNSILIWYSHQPFKLVQPSLAPWTLMLWVWRNPLHMDIYRDYTLSRIQDWWSIGQLIIWLFLSYV